MKKKIFLASSFIASIIIAANSFCITYSNSTTKSDLLTANIEALTIEAGESAGNTVDCYSSSSAKKGSTYYDCGSCSKQFNSVGTGSARTCTTSN